MLFEIANKAYFFAKRKECLVGHVPPYHSIANVKVICTSHCYPFSTCFGPNTVKNYLFRKENATIVLSI